MKKLLFLISLVSVILLGSSFESKAQDVFYNRVNIINFDGVNVTDFIFTYDSNSKCRNNFKVENNLNVRSTFNFTIKLDGVVMYYGAVTIAPFGNVYFNNAFVDCSSASKTIEIQCY